VYEEVAREAVHPQGTVLANGCPGHIQDGVTSNYFRLLFAYRQGKKEPGMDG
jgi:hypothetical protein